MFIYPVFARTEFQRMAYKRVRTYLISYVGSMCTHVVLFFWFHERILKLNKHCIYRHHHRCRHHHFIYIIHKTLSWWWSLYQDIEHEGHGRSNMAYKIESLEENSSISHDYTHKSKQSSFFFSAKRTQETALHHHPSA